MWKLNVTLWRQPKFYELCSIRWTEWGEIKPNRKNWGFFSFFCFGQFKLWLVQACQFFIMCVLLKNCSFKKIFILPMKHQLLFWPWKWDRNKNKLQSDICGYPSFKLNDRSFYVNLFIFWRNCTARDVSAHLSPSCCGVFHRIWCIFNSLELNAKASTDSVGSRFYSIFASAVTFPELKVYLYLA